MGRRVLVVDDDDGIRQFIRMALEDAGYEVVPASDGRGALEAIEGAAPDLIFLDMRMPVMDGWTFARTYRSGPSPHAPIVVLTAARDAAQNASEIDADAFLAKPFPLRDLIGLAARFAPPRA